MCIHWIQDKYSVVITQQSNPPFSQRQCNEFTSPGSHAIVPLLFTIHFLLPQTSFTLDILLVSKNLLHTAKERW